MYVPIAPDGVIAGLIVAAILYAFAPRLGIGSPDHVWTSRERLLLAAIFGVLVYAAFTTPFDLSEYDRVR